MGALGATFLLLAGCATATPALATALKASSFNAIDTAWIQLMIPMNELLLLALDLAPPGLAPFAAGLRASHEKELTDLKRLRTRAGLPNGNAHAGH